jgi:hypothetical protein
MISAVRGFRSTLGEMILFLRALRLCVRHVFAFAFPCASAPLRENVFAFIIQSVSRLSARSFFFFACVAPLRETPSFVFAFIIQSVSRLSAS